MAHHTSDESRWVKIFQYSQNLYIPIFQLFQKYTNIPKFQVSIFQNCGSQLEEKYSKMIKFVHFDIQHENRLFYLRFQTKGPNAWVSISIATLGKGSKHSFKQSISC